MAQPGPVPASPSTEEAKEPKSIETTTPESEQKKERKAKKEKKEKKEKRKKEKSDTIEKVASETAGSSSSIAAAPPSAPQEITPSPTAPLAIIPASDANPPTTTSVPASLSTSPVSSPTVPINRKYSEPVLGLSPPSLKPVLLLRQSTDKRAPTQVSPSRASSSPVAISSAHSDAAAKSPSSDSPGSPARARSNSIFGRLFTREKGRKESPSRDSPQSDDERDKTPERAKSPTKDSFNSGKVVLPATRIKVGAWEDLPSDIQKALSKANITKAKAAPHWNLLLYCIEFVVKCKFDRTNPVETLFAETPRLVEPIWPEHPAYLPWEKLLSPIEEFKAYTANAKGAGGHGGFGVVTAATDASGGRVAIKKMEEWIRPSSSTLAELCFLKSSSHPNLVAWVQAFKLDKDIMLVTEYLDGGGLNEVCRKHNLEEPEMAYIATSVLTGLNYLHERQLLHRDLKTANIMLSRTGDVKLIDFGLVCALHEGKKYGMVGSPFWMSPEMIRLDAYSYQTDVWSFGITMLELANRTPPNVGSQLRAMFLTATEGIPEKPFTYAKHWSTECKNFILACLAFDPNARPLVPVLLKNPWLSKACGARHLEKCISSAFMGNTYDALNIS